MKIKKILIISSIVIILVCIYFIPGFILAERWNIISKEVKAIGGECSYQIGLTKTTISQCMPSCYVGTAPAACCAPSPGATGAGAALCPTIVPKNGSYETTCPLYSGVSGMPAGGMGNSALFTNIAIAESGLTPSSQLIACGLTMTNMDQGILASVGGCSGCSFANLNVKDKFVMWLSDFFIAGKREQ